MSRTIHIRNVPDEIHRELKARAGRAGMSLSGYLLREIERVATVPSFDEWWRDVQEDGSVLPDRDTAALVRAEREADTRISSG